MGKIMESMGIIDGYEITTIGKFKVKREEAFEEIVKVDERILDETKN